MNFAIGARVRYIEPMTDGSTLWGKVVGYTTLGEMYDGDCDPKHVSAPFCKLEWDGGGKGLESEGMLSIL